MTVTRDTDRAMTRLVGDENLVDWLVNNAGLDQMTACRIVWAGDTPSADLGPLPPDPRTATPAEHRAWGRVWVRRAVLAHLGPVLTWLARRSPVVVRDLLERP